MEQNPSSQAWPSLSRPLARLVFPARHVGILAAGAVALFLPSLGDRRWLITVVCLLVLLPIDVAMHAHTRRTDRFPRVMPYVNQFLAFGIVLAAPAAFAPAAVLLLADDALTALVFGRRTALKAGVLGCAMFAGSTALVDVVDPWPLIAALAIGSVSCASVLGAIAEAERTLRARYHALVGEVDVIVWEMVPGTNRFSYVSPGAEAMLGHPLRSWYRPGFWVEHLHPADADRVLAELDDALAAGVDHVLEYRMVHADLSEVHLRDVAAVEVDSSGKVVNMRGVMMDISDRRRAEELLRQRATHDVLTDLPNRALLADRIEQALKESRRTGDPVALLLLDLDDFKEVNDALGHEAGDRLLVAFADRLRTELRGCDTIARLGGDEFAVLLTTSADAAGATLVARRIIAALGRPFDIDGMLLTTSSSIGVALFPEHAADANDLVGRADVAMYLAKRSGRGVALYEAELERTGTRRITLLADLRQALADESLRLEFQPCFDLATGRLASVEALLRWDHVVQGRVGPTDFIRLAEMSGLIEPLTRWVIKRSVNAYRAARLQVPISVNLSVRNLGEPDLVAWIHALLRDTGLREGQLVLELTESAVMADVPAAVAVLHRLRALGVEFAIDDFGTGQSALAYLKDLPVDELKIDRVFVEGVGSDRTDAAICASIITLAHELELRVVAEGASDERDVATLRRLGCDRVQGFFLGQPVGEDELASLADRVMVGDQPPALTP